MQLLVFIVETGTFLVEVESYSLLLETAISINVDSIKELTFAVQTVLVNHLASIFVTLQLLLSMIIILQERESMWDCIRQEVSLSNNYIIVTSAVSNQSNILLRVTLVYFSNGNTVVIRLSKDLSLAQAMHIIIG